MKIPMMGYESKAACEKRVKELKKSYEDLCKKDGKKHPLSPLDEKFMRELFQFYYTPDEGEAKYTQDQIKRIFVGKHPSYASYCFWLEVEINGKLDEVTFSTGRVFAPKNRTFPNKVDRLKAFRLAINDQLQVFKDQEKRQGKVVEKMEVDHVAPKTFQWLLDDFLKKNNKKLEDVGVKYDNNTKQYSITDKNLMDKWKKYHEENAKLELVDRKENLARYIEYLKHFSD